MWGFGEEVLPGCFPRGLTDAISWTDTDDTASTMNGRDGRGREGGGEGGGRGSLGRSCFVCSPLRVLGNLLILPSFVATTFIPPLRTLAFLLRH